MAKKLSETDAVSRLEKQGYQVNIDNRYLNARKGANAYQVVPTSDGRYSLAELRKIPA